MNKAVKIHPRNNKIFEFRNKPLVLVCASEHYGAVMNRPFDYKRYLADAAEKSQTLSRLFLLFRELQFPPNPYSTCKPETPDYVAPFKRVGPKLACDYGPVYDLNQWNPEFFDRLHGFLSCASDYGVIIEIVLFGNQFVDQIWKLCPMHPDNNINKLGKIDWIEFQTKRNKKLFEYQCEYVKKIVREINKYDNFYFEICNEPFTKINLIQEYGQQEIDDWQMSIAKLIRKIESKLPNKHLIAGQAAWLHTEADWNPIDQPIDPIFKKLDFDIVNVHPMANLTLNNKKYDLGKPLSKQLCLLQFRDFCLAAAKGKKPVSIDEDNAASCFLDYDGWTIQRKRAWTSLFCGCHYDMIDFSINKFMETGTPESQKCIRTWMKHLSQFINSLDLIRSRPLSDFIISKPQNVVESVFGVPGKIYCVYLADARELTDKNAGSDINDAIAFKLPKGSYKIACCLPETGLYSPWISMNSKGSFKLSLPAFKHDIIVKIIANVR